MEDSVISNTESQCVDRDWRSRGQARERVSIPARIKVNNDTPWTRMVAGEGDMCPAPVLRVPRWLRGGPRHSLGQVTAQYMSSVSLDTAATR